MNTIRKTVLAVVLALIGSANLWATDYIFGYSTGSNTNDRHFLCIPESPSSTGSCTVVTIDNLDQLQRSTWHCVSSKGSTTGSNISTSTYSSSQSYLYVEYNGSKYWLKQNGTSVEYTTASDDATGYNYNTSSEYLRYSSTQAKINSYSIKIGSCGYVCVSKNNTGKVYVTTGTSYTGTPSASSDKAHRMDGKSGTTYYQYTVPASGYIFKGWSKTNSFSSIDINPGTVDSYNRYHAEYKLDESSGYAVLYYAMFVPYWNFSASGNATSASAGHGTVSVNLAKSEIVATDNSTTTGTTTATFTATASSGYGFVGWTDTLDGTTANQGTDNPKTVTITNTTPGSTATVTLYAIFKSAYVVHFHPNADTPHSVTGSMPDMTFVCGVDGTLPANTFVNTISTTFDGNGGQLKHPSTGTFVDSYTLTQSATFHYWTDKGSPEVTYWDKGTVNRSESTDLNLYARWNNPAVTYPEGKRGDRTLTKFDNGKTVGDKSWPSYSYTIKALWSDPFYASMAVTKTAGTDGTPTVDKSSLSSDYKGSNSGSATFTLTAPAAKSGYYFSGWTGTGITFDSANSLSTTATVAVSNTAGSSNAASYTATANYAEYPRTITINANGTPSSSGDMVVFNVTGPQTYRVSVPVGGSVVLKDVASGDYTITPQGWSWNYTVSPASDATGWNSENKSTHTFNFTTKGSTKKHDEVSKTIVKP